jgi:peptidoglycan/LPS O-acetylase OafA/YrhL
MGPPISPRHNNFEALRLLAASAVILAHAYGIRGLDGTFTSVTGVDLGWSAVVMFFCISGYLVSGSALHRGSYDFWKARFLRIYPGLLACTILTGTVLVLFSSLEPGEYFRNWGTWKFIFGTGTLISTTYHLPGVFDNLYSTEANGSLWTLRYEVLCYFIIFVILKLSGLLRTSASGLIAFSSIGCVISCAALIKYAYASVPHQVINLLEFFIPFSVGAWFQASEVRPPTWLLAILTVVSAIVFSRTPFQIPCYTLAISAITLHLAFSSNPLLTLASKCPDYSYGIYIYAYPIQQVIALEFPAVHPLLGAALGLLCVLLPAALSWHFVEKPALSLKESLRVQTYNSS